MYTDDNTPQEVENNKLYVGNLSWYATTDHLNGIFAQYCTEGTTLDVFIVKDKETGRSRGMAFVTFINEANAEAAIDDCAKALEGANGMELEGREIRLSYATKRKPREDRPYGRSFDN
jgi:cold-inducible RNA-binding protein